MELAKRLTELPARLSNGLVPWDSVIGSSMRDLVHHKDTRTLLVAEMTAGIIGIIQYRGGSISESGAANLAADIIENYPALSPEGWAKFINSVKVGVVSSPIRDYEYPKVYGKIVPGVVMDWLRIFQEAISDVYESRAMESRKAYGDLPEILSPEQVAESYKKIENEDRKVVKAPTPGEIFRANINALNVIELEIVYSKSDDPQVEIRHRKYWEDTPLRTQANEWSETWIRYSKDGKTHLYLFGDVAHTRPMWNYMEKTIKEEEPDAMAHIKNLAFEAWKARLVEDGQEIKGETSKEINDNLDRRKPISNPILHYRAAIAGYWSTNMI